MSLRALDWVLSLRVRPVAGPAAKLILFALADEADDSGTCCSSDQLIAAKCEVSEEVVRRTIRRLAEAN
jgi:Helix-turn-helix domain